VNPQERISYSPIVDRAPLELPEGVRMVIWPVVALENWKISRPMARTVISPPQGQPRQPDHPNWSWHEYGMRVGFWRIKAMLEQLSIPATVMLNASVYEDYPRVVEACVDAGWELAAHSYEQLPMHDLDDEAEVIHRSISIMERAWGRKPRGWFGPGLTQTLDTVDYLAAEGIDYIGDWVLDDEPVRVRTTSREMVALPYNFELHDIVMMNLQHHPSDELFRRAMDHFECLYAESARRPKIMSIAMHPYLSGVPHRIAWVRQCYEKCLEQPGVVAWSGEQILDWYLQTPVTRTVARPARSEGA
jgi:peptidoglycan/xylan/chitin deacetylase (PgdA/CDA1 family)